VNRKPGFAGKEFYWHSDFETWHVEDGMPGPRAVSLSIALTDNRPDNGSLMIIPGSHKTFVSCVGETPENHYRQSLRAQNYGVPDDESLSALVDVAGIDTAVLQAGSAVAFDANAMHGSNGNITPFGRCNIFVVFNSVENPLQAPFGGMPPRPTFLASR
jgi:ectoine hydroxylase